MTDLPATTDLIGATMTPPPDEALMNDMADALEQYIRDLTWPPTGGSVQRRIQMAEALLKRFGR